MPLPPPDDNVLPFRLKQSTFRLYEHYISEAIRLSPEPISINPAPLRSTTFAARLRDAILSFDKYRWTASFSSLEFDEAYNTGGLTVSHGDHIVLLGPRAIRKGGKAPGQSVAFNNPNDKRLDGIFVHEEIDRANILAFCLLLGSKLLSGPVILESNALTEAEVSDLESTYDIAITFNEKGHTIII